MAFQDDIPEADLYGITATSADYLDAVEVASILKFQLATKETRIVLGGRHVTGMRGNVDDIFDVIVIGEGEHAIQQLVEDYPNLYDVYNLPVVEDLDTIPFPARHLLPVQGGNVFAYGKRYWEGETTCLLTMRGCPFKCAFCTAGGERVRYRSVDNVIAEIEHVKETLRRKGRNY